MDAARAGVPRAGGDIAAAPDRPYLLERAGEAAVVQLYADGFASLTPREETLAYHLYLAAIAGRDIYYDQRYGRSIDAIVDVTVSYPLDLKTQTLEYSGARAPGQDRLGDMEGRRQCVATESNRGPF